MRVAVIDSGIDATHPEFEGKIADAESFVGGSARVDAEGHGTFVAGLIAAGVDNAVGIAGMAPSAELLVAKVVERRRPDRRRGRGQGDPLGGRAAAPSVINMSLGGFRDPATPTGTRSRSSRPPRSAWAHGKGVVVVAAVGNSDEVPPTPWPFASYPAALPHVLGVSALARDGSVPAFSNRDKIYNDITAPGQGIVSTFPLDLTVGAKECVDQGYSTCANEEFADFRKGEGTSFAAPQVSAAAAVLLAVRPSLRPEQVTALADADGARRQRCDRMPSLPAAARRAHRLGPSRRHRGAAPALRPDSGARPARAERRRGRPGRSLWGQTNRLEATLDFWDDQNDVYAIRLRRRQPVYISVRGPAGHDTNLILWSPGTKHVDDLASIGRVARQSARPGPARVPLLPRAEGRHVLRPGEARRTRRGPLQARDRQGLKSRLTDT